MSPAKTAEPIEKSFGNLAEDETNGQSNLTQGRITGITATCGRFSRISQVAPMCTRT